MALQEKREFIFMWKIENFSICTLMKGEYLDSPVFKAENLKQTSWYLQLYPRGREYSKDRYMACYLYRCQNDEGPFEIECEFEIQAISLEEKIITSNETSHRFLKGNGWGWCDFWLKVIEVDNVHEVLNLRCSLRANVLKIPQRAESVATTQLDYNEYYFTWIVKNLNSNCSEIIKFPNTDTQVEILIEVPEDDVKIEIRKVEGFVNPLHVVCQVTLLDLEERQHDSRQDMHLFKKIDPPIKSEIWRFPNFLKKSKLNSEKEKYLKNDCFGIKFKVIVSNGTQTSSVEKQSGPFHAITDASSSDTGTTKILEDMKSLYNGKIHADIKLLVNGQIIQAHKNILSVRSPVFLAMFDTDMVENKTGTVTIPDLEVETVNSLLEYMYTGTVKELDFEIAKKLIAAADKYQVLPLIEECVLFLKSVLCHSKVCDILITADLIQHKELKTATIDYIQNNCEYIFKSKEWQNIIENNVQLATDTFIQVSEQFAANVKKP